MSDVSIINDHKVQPFLMQDAIDEGGWLLTTGTTRGDCELADGDVEDRVDGIAFAGTKDPITNIAGTDVGIGLASLQSGDEISVRLSPTNQIIAFDDLLCLSGNAAESGTVDLRDGSTQTNVSRYRAQEAKSVNDGATLATAYILARVI